MFLIRPAQFCTQSLHFAWRSVRIPGDGDQRFLPIVQRVSDRNRTQLFLRGSARSLPFGTNLRRADSLFLFIVFSFGLRRLTVQPSSLECGLMPHWYQLEIAARSPRRTAFSPVSAKVACRCFNAGVKSLPL